MQGRGDNDQSANVVFVYKSFQGLFTGDSSTTIENAWYTNCAARSNMLKMGHHGSKTSTGNAIVNYVKPEVSIAMNGYINSHGHPNKQAIANAEKSAMGITQSYTLNYDTLNSGSPSVIKTLGAYRYHISGTVVNSSDSDRNIEVTITVDNS